MKIYVTIKSVYGKTLVYPACTQANLFCQIANKVTLSKQDLICIKKLGFVIIQGIPCINKEYHLQNEIEPENLTIN